MKEIDYKHGEKISILCIFGNIMLSIIKLAGGIYGGSKAMIADALHSASDIVTTIVVIIGIRIARKPIDKEHPYGHGKVEPICAALLGVILVFAASAIIKGSVESIRTHSFATPTFLALAAAILSIAVKEGMYRMTYAAGKNINSESIMADALHHRSDAFSSIGSFFGILGSMIGNWLNIHFLEYLDPIAGVLVACFIFKVAYKIVKQAVKNLMDTSPCNEKILSIKDTASSVEGIISIPFIKGRYVGQHLYIDMEIEVSPDITVEEGHDIAARVRGKVIETIGDVFDVMVHVEPETTDCTSASHHIPF